MRPNIWIVMSGMGLQMDQDRLEDLVFISHSVSIIDDGFSAG